MSLLPTDEDLLDILSPEAKAALVALQSESENNDRELKISSTTNFVSEDFGYSQFWYDDNTSNILANEAINGSNEANIITNSVLQNSSSKTLSLPTSGSICCLMAPSAFKALKLLNVPNRIVLFEFDKRFV